MRPALLLEDGRVIETDRPSFWRLILPWALVDALALLLLFAWSSRTLGILEHDFALFLEVYFLLMLAVILTVPAIVAGVGAAAQRRPPSGGGGEKK